MVFINHTEVLDGKVVIMEVEGPLNSETSPDFEDYTNKLIENGIKYILFNAGKLEFVSSEGIGVTLLLEKRISEKNGYFIIFDLPEEVRALYEIIGFDKIFNTAASRIEAMQIMDKQIELREETGDTQDDFTEEEIDLTADEFADMVVPEKPEKIITDKKDYNDFDEIPEEFTFNNPSDEKTDSLPEKKDRLELTPFVVECAECNSLVRVKKSGDYLCPSCKAEFTVLEDSTVIF